MDKRTLAMIAVVFLSGEVQAFPVEAIGSFFAKLFKGGTVAKEAATAGRAVEGAAIAKGVEHIPAGTSVNHAGSSLQSVAEPKANTIIEPIAQSRKDSDAYKALRTSASKGDSTAMLRMSEMTASGKVSDPGEPYYAYWLFQAARAGNQVAFQKLREECSGQEYKRGTDRWFDNACGTTDGRNLNSENRVTGSYSPTEINPTTPKR